MKQKIHLIVATALILGSTSFASCQERQQITQVNINTLAPDLPLYQTKAENREERQQRSIEVKQWIDEHYEQYDQVRNHILQMFFEETAVLTVTVNGVETNANEIYNLKGWELSIGYNDEQFAEFKQRLQTYRESHQE